MNEVLVFDAPFVRARKFIDRQFFDEIEEFETKLAESNISLSKVLDTHKSRARAHVSVGREYPKSRSSFRRSFPVFSAFYNGSGSGRVRPNIAFLCESFLFLNLAGVISASSHEVESVAMLACMSASTAPGAHTTHMNNLEFILPAKLTREAVESALDDLAQNEPSKFNGNRAREAEIALRGLLELCRKAPPSANPKSGGRKRLEEHTKDLSRVGHDLRPEGMLGGFGREALSLPEARKAMRVLVDFRPIEPLDRISKLAIFLSAITGHNADLIAAALCGLPTECLLNKIRINANSVDFSISHLRGNKLPEEPNSGVRLELKWSAKLPSEYRGRKLTDGEKHSEDPQVIKASLSKLSGLIRNEVPFFTPTKFRGSFVQQLWATTDDLPLTQLITGERLQQSDAALNYLAFRSQEVAAHWNRALSSLYGFKLSIQCLAPDSWWGAPKAPTSREYMNHALESIRRDLQKARRMNSPRALQKKHSYMVDVAVSAFVLCTGHRDSHSVADITLEDISVRTSVALVRDKKTSPALYRRIVVLADIVNDLLREYVDHLKRVRDMSRGKKRTPFLSAVDSALLAKSRLFFESSGDQINVIALLEKRTGEAGSNLDRHRHYAATWLRVLGANPTLVETHLGHNITPQLMGHVGAISPIELSESLLPALNELFPSNFSIKRETAEALTSYTLKKKDLEKLEQDELERDIDHFWSKLPKGKALDGAGDWLAEKAVNSISPDVMNSDSKGVITKQDSKEMRALILNSCRPSFAKVDLELAALWRLLSNLRDVHGVSMKRPSPANWFVGRPFALSRAHLVACDQLYALQSAFLNHFKNSSSYNAVLHALVLFGNCFRYDEAHDWLVSAVAGATKVGNSAYLVEVGEESRTIAGVAFFYVQKYISQRSRVTKESRFFGWCTGLGQEDIEKTVQLAVWVNRPGLEASFLTGEEQWKEATAARLKCFLENGFDGDGSQPLSGMQLENFLAPTLKRASPNAPLSDLGDIVSIVKQTSKSHNAKKILIEKFLAQGLSHIGELLAHWTIDLLGPEANIKTGKTLAQSTVLKYVSAVGAAVIRACGNGHPADFDSEELEERLASEICQGLKRDTELAVLINRFFECTAGKGLSQKIYLPVLPHDSGNIRATLVAPKEAWLASEFCLAWAKLESNTVQGLLIASNAAELARLGAYTGSRRRELIDARWKEVQAYKDETFISIRPHKDRPLKSRAATRVLPCCDLGSPTKGSNRVFEHLITPRDERLADSYCVAALRAASGVGTASFHTLRHSKATRDLLDAQRNSEPVARYKALNQIKTTIGHQAVTTTVTHYHHAFHYAVAVSTAERQLATLTGKQLANVMGSEAQPTKVTAANKRRRSGGLGCAPFSVLPATSSSTAVTQLLKSSPPSLLLGTDGKLGLADHYQFLVDYVNGKPLNRAGRALGVSRVQAELVLKLMLELAEQHQFTPVPLAVLDEDLNRLKSGDVMGFRSRKSHCRQAKDFAVRALAALREKPCEVAEILEELASRVTYKKGKTSLQIPLAFAADKLSQRLAASGLPLRMMQSEEKMTYRLLPTAGNRRAVNQNADIVVLLMSAAIRCELNRCK